MTLRLDHPYILTGNAEASVEAFRLSGQTDLNTDRGRLHMSNLVVGGDLQIRLFKDRLFTQQVADSTPTAAGAEATLTEVAGSGLTGTAFVREAIADTMILYVALASDLDIQERDDRIRGFLTEDPPEFDFRVIWRDVMREFYLRIQAMFPPPVFLKDPLRFPGTSSVQEAGRRGLPEIHSVDLWHLNIEGDWELHGLENPGDFREWAIYYALYLIWERRARSGDDNILSRADRHLARAERAWKLVPVNVDADRDQIPERSVKRRSMTIRRG